MPKQLPPLTDEQRARAERYIHLVGIIAAAACKKFPNVDRDRMISFAGDLMVKMARLYKPDMHDKGEDGFPLYAHYWMKRSIMQEAYRRRPDERYVTFSDLGDRSSRIEAGCERRHVPFRSDSYHTGKTAVASSVAAEAAANKKRRFAEMYLGGATLPAILAELKTCQQTLTRWRQQLGLPKRRANCDVR